MTAKALDLFCFCLVFPDRYCTAIPYLHLNCKQTSASKQNSIQCVQKFSNCAMIQKGQVLPGILQCMCVIARWGCVISKGCRATHHKTQSHTLLYHQTPNALYRPAKSFISDFLRFCVFYPARHVKLSEWTWIRTCRIIYIVVQNK